jgi:hypothetical protein
MPTATRRVCRGRKEPRAAHAAVARCRHPSGSCAAELGAVPVAGCRKTRVGDTSWAALLQLPSLAALDASGCQLCLEAQPDGALHC